MTKNTPDSAAINILREERLSDEMLGVELQVQVKDFGGQPVPGWPFSINTGNQVLAKGTTNESGEYRGQRVLQLREGARMRIFLVLEGSAVTAMTTIQEDSEDMSSPPRNTEKYPEHYEVDVNHSMEVDYSMRTLLMRFENGQISLEALLLGYAPSKFQSLYLCLMDDEVFKAKLNLQGMGPMNLLRVLVNSGCSIRDLTKVELDLTIEMWKATLKARCPDIPRLKTKLLCICLDLDRIKATLTTARLAKLVELDKQYEASRSH